MHPNFHLDYGILVRKYKNVTITLQKEQEHPLKISFCFQTGDNIVIYVSTHGHWDCTTLQHHCIAFGFASGYAEVLQGGTISMPTGRHVDNLYCHDGYSWLYFRYSENKSSYTIIIFTVYHNCIYNWVETFVSSDNHKTCINNTQKYHQIT